ncbi:hypothetical protein TSAR_015827 [Trichomalopsis sarcophagae]|uniref:Uncharacterized protein n=1 Tax=Trichomalopsis sarcophagae TaxID=543379 RepID=A0A232EEM3_9HYME|nr:hypothetical protein TSAR_015827 [Trichomalopsis sarcophagae]
MDNRTLVDLIADGLLAFGRNKIDRQEAANSVDLFSELRKCENTSGKSFLKIHKNRPKVTKTETKLTLKQPYKICESKGIYDPGLNITLINSKLVEIKNLTKDNFSSTIKTTSGRGKTDCLTTLNAGLDT